MSTTLKRLRTKRGLKVSTCSVSLGVSQSTYREWENGRSISGEPYIKLAQLFQVSISELFALAPTTLAQNFLDLEIAAEDLLNHVKSIRSRL